MNSIQVPFDDLEQLSCYLDNALSSNEKAALQARLQSSEALRAELAELNGIRLSLEALPKRKAPHNFTLTRQEAACAKRHRLLFPVFGTASLISGLLAILLFVLPLFGPGLLNSAPMATNAPMLTNAIAQESAPSSKEDLSLPAAPASAVAAVPDQSNADGNHPVTSKETPYFFFNGQNAKGGGGRGAGESLQVNNLSSKTLASPAQIPVYGPGNLGGFGNAPVGVIIPIEPVFGKLGETVRNASQMDAKTDSSKPGEAVLILGLNADQSGEILEKNGVPVNSDANQTNMGVSSPASDFSAAPSSMEACKPDLSCDADNNSSIDPAQSSWMNISDAGLFALIAFGFAAVSGFLAWKFRK